LKIEKKEKIEKRGVRGGKRDEGRGAEVKQNEKGEKIVNRN